MKTSHQEYRRRRPGSTFSDDFPTTPGAHDRTYNGEADFFVACLTPDGASLVYGTYIGGSGNEWISTHNLAIDVTGNAYVAIPTASPNYPVTPGAFQTAFRGGNTDWAITKFSPGGALIASTLIGGGAGENADGVYVDAAGNVFVTGETQSGDFPVTADAYQPQRGGGTEAVLVGLSADFSHLCYATYMGGPSDDNGRSGCLGHDGSLYVTGSINGGGWPTRSAYQSSYGGGSLDNIVATFTPQAESAGILRFDSPHYRVPEAGGAATVTVTRSGGSIGTVTVDYVTRDGTASAGADYAAASGTITFTDGENTPKTFSVGVTDDTVAEGDETIQLALSNPTGGALPGSPSSAVLTIADDDGERGPVDHWRFDDGAGTTATDAMGNGNDGRLVNGPVWTSGRTGGGVGFDGIDDYVQVPDAPELNVRAGREFTITFWMRGSDTSAAQMLLTKRDNAGYQVWFQPTKGFFFRIDEGPNIVETIAHTNPLDGQWHHVAVGRDVGQHFLFIDGAPDRTTTDATLADLTNHLPFDLGNESGFPTPAFNGVIDDVRVYDRALGSEEIRALFTLTVFFRRGDVNSDGIADISDAVSTLIYLFTANDSTPPCMKSADTNDDGQVDIADAVYVLAYLFAGGAPPRHPFSSCGIDQTADGLTCDAFPPCS